MSSFTIDVEKVRKARIEMEREILSAVESAVRKFKDTTGLTPEYISVDMADMRTTHSVMREYFPTAVKAIVNLEI